MELWCHRARGAAGAAAFRQGDEFYPAGARKRTHAHMRTMHMDTYTHITAQHIRVRTPAAARVRSHYIDWHRVVQPRAALHAEVTAALIAIFRIAIFRKAFLPSVQR